MLPIILILNLQLDTLNEKLRQSPTYGVQLGEIESYAVKLQFRRSLCQAIFRI